MQRLKARAIFFDAGGTLIFPDRERTLAPLHARDISVTQEQIHAAERAARHYRDASALKPTDNVDEHYWITYYRTLLANGAEEQLVTDLVSRSRTSANWTYVLPGTREHLLALKQNYRLAVISNSDGRLSQTFEQLGLTECFEAIIDSGNVGFHKPSPQIFQVALETVGVAAGESVYVGDVYSIDYLGATAVGMQAVLIDQYGTYRSNGKRRIESICELGSMLQPV